MATQITAWGRAAVDAHDAEAVLHDVRGYLTIIRGQCHALVRDGSATSGAIARLRAIDVEVGRIDEAVSRVREVLRDGVLPSRPPSRVDLRERVERARGRLEGIARARGVTLRSVATTSGVQIEGWVDQLDRVLDNLVLNAIRAAGHGGSVGIAVDCDGGEATLCVTNDLQRVPSGGGEGWGIGLQIVRSIVACHGGELNFSTDGRKAAVWIALPATGGQAGAR